MLALGDAKGVQVVTVFPNAFAYYFGKQPLRTIDDFKGKKLRVNATPAERAKMRQFGATAVPMDLSEVIPGLQQGVIDGTMSGAAVYVNLKFNDIAKVLTEVNDTLIVSVGSVSKAWLNKLPSDLRSMVVEEGRKLHGRAIAEARTVDEAMLQRWKSVGGEVVALPATEQAKVRTLLAGIGEEVTKDNPAVNAFYKRMLATAQKY
jgi:TRAP-type C4-dicarboxylate transport system substrate-binding protein